MIALGSFHSCLIDVDNAGYCFGWNDQDQLTLPVEEWKILSLGGQHSCGLSQQEELLCWGQNSAGQTVVPDEF